MRALHGEAAADPGIAAKDRLLDARHLDEDSVAAFGDDRDLLGAARVDAAADDITGNPHRILQRLGGTRRSRGEDNARRIDDLYVPIAIAGQRDRLTEAPHPL